MNRFIRNLVGGIHEADGQGETGAAYWRTQHFGGIRVRMVEYTPGYLADHWCSKGHILLCIEGELHTQKFQDRNHRPVRRIGREIHGRPAGTVMTVAFELDGQAFTALNGVALTCGN